MATGQTAGTPGGTKPVRHFEFRSFASCIPSFRFSYIEAKGLRGRLGVYAKAQANLPDV